MSSEPRAYEQKIRAERRRETRRRIVEATVGLHREVGPAKTTIAEVARRAGVSRLTVYHHFPDETELFAACQGLFMELNPPPDLGPAMLLADPIERIREALHMLYRWYRQAAPVTDKVQHDRRTVPALDALMRRTGDAQHDRTARLLASGFHRRGKPAERLRCVVRLALDFWTWRRLTSEGLNDAEAAEVMTGVIATLGSRGEKGSNGSPMRSGTTRPVSTKSRATGTGAQGKGVVGRGSRRLRQA
jgi:AcrR family transcriptional regulator